LSSNIVDLLFAFFSFEVTIQQRDLSNKKIRVPMKHDAKINNNFETNKRNIDYLKFHELVFR